MSDTQSIAPLTQTIETQAYALSQANDEDAVAKLTELVDGQREALEKARDRVALRLHGNASDYQSTAALRLLNRTIQQVGWTYKYDWRSRLTNKVFRRA